MDDGPSAYARLLERERAFGRGRFVRAPTEIAALRAFVAGSSAGLDYGDPRYWDHQNDATRRIVAHLCDPDEAPQAISVIPTGGGKTEIFLRLLDAFRRDRGDAMVLPNTVVLVPTLQMISQTLDRFAAHCPALPVGHWASQAAVAADGSRIAPRIRPVTVMTYHGFVRLVQRGRIGPADVDVLVLDEAHRALSDLRQEVFGGFLGNTLVTAFSATPAFDRYRNLHALLGEANEVVRISAKTLRDAGIIAPCINYVFAVKFAGRLPADADARALAKKRRSIASILDFYETYAEPSTGQRLFGRTAICYAADIDHAHMTAAEFDRRYAARGMRMVALSGEDSQDRQRRVLDALRAGEITAVISVKLLEEGIDVPRVGVVLNFASTDSPVREVQRCGRGMRLDRTLPPDADQTTFVVDGYYELNGRFLDNPRFYFETVDDPSIARFVSPQMTERPMGHPDRFRADSGLDTTGRYRVSAGVAHVAYLLRGRDGADPEPMTDDWLSKLRLKQLAGKAPGRRDWNRRIDALWAAMERAYAEAGRIRYDGRDLQAEYRRPDDGRPVFCIHVCELDTIARILRTWRPRRPELPVPAEPADTDQPAAGFAI